MNPRLALNWLPFPLPSAKVLGVPVLIMILLSMLVLPLPPFLLDVLFTFNIAVSLVVLMVASYNVKPLQFSSFPTVLLLTTMLRLGLSVASTRAILQHGHTGTEAAGKVIESFANLLLGGKFSGGLIVLLILKVVNFMVVTKGAGRIAEVSARFALDAMPGKQMAIDADLSAGLIDEKEARRRRLEVGQEADFFGSMDGASKFVRGDAIAAMIILGVNIVGGLAIGLMQHNMPLDRALSNYTLLAVGDALVAQIPSLIISLAAGLIVSRVGDDEDIGGQVTSQLFTMPRALGLTAGVMALLGII
ncbi:MAG: FHIPEP family type III secretion protein, partial [Burkholderiales bacterium]